jgi:hypothetical protein
MNVKDNVYFAINEWVSYELLRVENKVKKTASATLQKQRQKYSRLQKNVGEVLK